MDDAPGSDPLAILLAWHADALRTAQAQPDAMTLATATRDGKPSARIVYFKGIADGAIRFVSNFHSRKGQEMAENPEVALLFFWPGQLRQARVEGRAERAAPGDSDAYFRSRPRESQLGAWASDQSRPIASRAELIARYAEAEARFRGRDVERPPHWGVYRVEPRVVELWYSGEHRLHDRFVFERSGDGWACTRLAP